MSNFLNEGALFGDVRVLFSNIFATHKTFKLLKLKNYQLQDENVVKT